MPSSFDIAIQTVLKHEGAILLNNPITGEYSKYGISLRFLRSVFPAALPSDIEGMTEEYAKKLYRTYFWDTHRLSELNYQPLSTAVLDMTVNMGPGGIKKDGRIIDGGITLLQRTLNQLRVLYAEPLTIDGIVGERTINAANQAIPDTLLKLYIEHVKLRYQEIANADPIGHGGDIGGWIKRADRLLA